ncbi:MAG TPA: hypothetical protein VLF67_01190 [Candidatus Saccharimonas sp.]|nr:hypothetical protein [Candidatus Saccharimonas sp.]
MVKRSVFIDGYWVAAERSEHTGPASEEELRLLFETDLVIYRVSHVGENMIVLEGESNGRELCVEYENHGYATVSFFEELIASARAAQTAAMATADAAPSE